MSAMPFLSIGGARLAHECRGPREGAAVLFLHGLGSSSADWLPVLPAFEARHRIILADLPGHGDSDADAGTYAVGTSMHRMEVERFFNCGARRSHGEQGLGNPFHRSSTLDLRALRGGNQGEAGRAE